MLRRVNAILVAEPAFRRGGNFQLVDDGHDAVIAVFRKDDQPGRTGFLVVCNFDILGEQDIEIDLSTHLGTKGPIKCVDLMDDEEQTFPSPRLSFRLSACAVQVLQF